MVALVSQKEFSAQEPAVLLERYAGRDAIRILATLTCPCTRNRERREPLPNLSPRDRSLKNNNLRISRTSPYA